MKITQIMVVGLVVLMGQIAHGMQQGPSIGQDVLYGAGTGVASLGVFYGAQSYLNETEGRALALSTLTGIVLAAGLQASAHGRTGDYVATLVAAIATFGLTKYINEQNQAPASQDQGGTGSSGGRRISFRLLKETIHEVV